MHNEEPIETPKERPSGVLKQSLCQPTELDEANSLIDKLIEQVKYKDNIISSLRQTIDNIVKLLRENSLL